MQASEEMAVRCAEEYLASRERLGFPLLERPASPETDGDEVANG